MGFFTKHDSYSKPFQNRNARKVYVVACNIVVSCVGKQFNKPGIFGGQDKYLKLIDTDTKFVLPVGGPDQLQSEGIGSRYQLDHPICTDAKNGTRW